MKFQDDVIGKKSESICKWIGDNLLFAEFLESDQRSPMITFQIPGLLTKSVGMGSGKLGVVAPSIQFWFAIAVVRSSNNYFDGLVALDVECP